MTTPSDASPAAGDLFFFADAAAWRSWLDAHHESEEPVWVGFHKAGTGRRSVTMAEAVDVAICYGWIDGVRRAVDSMRWAIRFAPRRAGSLWSDANVARVAALTKAGLMRPEGRAAFESRVDPKAEAAARRAEAALTEDEEAQFRADRAAWNWFHASTPAYQRTAIRRVAAARDAAERADRLALLIRRSAQGRRA